MKTDTAATTFQSFRTSMKDAGVSDWQAMVEEFRTRCRQEGIADACQFLEDHPEIYQNRSAVIDVAFQEYCARLEYGSVPDIDAFCKQFPNINASLKQLIEAHQLFADHADQLIGSEMIVWPQVGEDWMHFQLLEELGQGAFAKVYLACDRNLGNRKVVLKLAYRGQDEAHILGKLTHANIVQIYSIEQDPESGLTGICMAYHGRVTLCQLLDHAYSKPKPPASSEVILESIREHDPAAKPSVDEIRWKTTSYSRGIVAIAQQLVAALKHAHQKGIRHLDIKPSNILLAADGTPLLLDFNLSQDTQQENSQFGGTLPYMSPEQLRALKEPKNLQNTVDDRSDLYSLGVVLYELLSGEHPFQPLPGGVGLEQVRQLLLERQQQSPVALRKLNPDMDPELEQIVHRCLRFDPMDRPQSAEALEQELQNYQSTRRSIQRWCSRNRWKLLISTIVFLCLFGYVAYAYMTHDPAREAYQLAMKNYQSGNYQTAISHLNQSIQLQDTVNKRLLRAKTYQQLEKYALARKDYQYLEENLKKGVYSAAIGYCYHREGYPSMASGYYNTAMKSDFKHPGVYNNLAVYYIRQSNRVQAMSLLNQAIELDPNFYYAYHNRVRCYSGLITAARQKWMQAENAPEQQFYKKQIAELIHDAMIDVELTIKHAAQPVSSYIYYTAVKLQAVAIHLKITNNPQLCIEYLKLLLQSQPNHSIIYQLQRNSLFKFLADDPTYQQLIQLKTKSNPHPSLLLYDFLPNLK